MKSIGKQKARMLIREHVDLQRLRLFRQALIYAAVLTLALTGLVRAQTPDPDTSFTYQGQLVRDGEGVDETCDFRFTVFDDPAGGEELAGPLAMPGVPVRKGIFTVLLDFGPSLGSKTGLWLGIGVKCAQDADFLAMSPLQRLGGLFPFGSGQAWLLNGNANTVYGTHFLGTTDNVSLTLRVNNVVGWRLAPSNDFINDPGKGVPNIVGGFVGNSIDSGFEGSVIGGGGAAHNINLLEAGFGVIGGGDNNHIQNAPNSVIDGGATNQIIGGAGGAGFHTVGGGLKNTIRGDLDAGTISGGRGNAIHEGANNSSIGGGEDNQIGTFAAYGTISAGENNVITKTATYGAIGGGGKNLITSWSHYSTVSGGESNQITGGSDRSTIGGGKANHIDSNSGYVVIAGGEKNRASSLSTHSFIAGGQENHIERSTTATIAGGERNTITGTSNLSAIGGGFGNQISGSTWAVVAGGSSNDITGDAQYAAVGGGHNNDILGPLRTSVIAGGDGNKIDGLSGQPAGNPQVQIAGATISGGTDNVISGTAAFATIPGGAGNLATAPYSFAAGVNAQAIHDGAFVWADNSLQPFKSTASNQFAARANGGYRFTGGAVSFNDSFTFPTGDGASGQVLVTDGSGNVTWQNSGSASDRTIKTDFSEIDRQTLLESLAGLPISRWRYTYETEDVRHLGPTAQDFAAAFGLGDSDTRIATVDATGVALAASQELYALLLAQQEQLTQQQALLSRYEERLQELEAQLAAQRGGSDE